MCASRLDKSTAFGEVVPATYDPQSNLHPMCVQCRRRKLELQVGSSPLREKLCQRCRTIKRKHDALFRGSQSHDGVQTRKQYLVEMREVVRCKLAKTQVDTSAPDWSAK